MNATSVASLVTPAPQKLGFIPMHKRPYALLKDSPAPSPTARSPDVQQKLHICIHRLHSKGTPVPVPTAAAHSDLVLLHNCMSKHSMGSHYYVPTATLPTARLWQL
jgi:hypothetical protein